MSTFSYKELFGFFLALNALAAYCNHFDDVDEPYGYYEPLHYLLYGIGMQTWEYSPEFALRSYAFISPMLLASKLLLTISPSLTKIEVFYTLRMLIGVFFAACETSFVCATHDTFQGYTFIVTTALLAATPGIFYSSTSFLPSAVCSGFVMLATSSWLRGQPITTVVWGSLAAIFTGWPFACVLFVPFGLHLLVSLPSLGGKAMFCIKGTLHYVYSDIIY
jgi:alpha-1,2-mannosyltransferase